MKKTILYILHRFGDNFLRTKNSNSQTKFLLKSPFRFVLVVFMILLFGVSCQQENKNTSVLSYFDTALFVQDEMNSVLSKNYAAEKTIALQSEKEFLTIEKIDTAFLNNELKLLKAGNINKPALLGFFAVDTSTPNEIKYTRKSNSKSKTKFLKISYNEANEPETINMILTKQNFMHAYRKEVLYSSEKEITVSAWEKTLFQDTLFYNTKLVFTK